jgi:hypothetical protein
MMALIEGTQRQQTGIAGQQDLVVGSTFGDDPGERTSR